MSNSKTIYSFLLFIAVLLMICLTINQHNKLQKIR